MGLMPTDGVGTDHPFTPQKKIVSPPGTRGQESPLRGRQRPWCLPAAGGRRGHGGDMAAPPGAEGRRGRAAALPRGAAALWRPLGG